MITDLSHLRVSFVAGTLAQGGSERQLYYIVRALARAGAAAQVLSLTAGEYWQDKIEAAGIEVRWVGRNRSQVARLKAIADEVRRFRPSVLQSQHFYTNPYVLCAARWNRVREVGAIRSGTRWAVARDSAFIRKFALLQLRTIAANSRESIEEAVELGVRRERLTLLPNVIDIGQFQPAIGAPGPNVELLAVGRLGPEKRHDLFLKVLARARALSSRPIVGRIVGAGTLQESLEAQAAALGLIPGTVTFSGAVADMPGVYQQSGILVLTSDHEGTPNVVMEAMACGLPVVATNVGGVADLIDHERTGLICPRGDENAICLAVLRLVENPGLARALGERARQVVEQRYSDAVLPSWLEGLYGARAS